MNEDESIDPDPDETRGVQVRVIDGSGKSSAEEEALEDGEEVHVLNVPIDDEVERLESPRLESLSVRSLREAAPAEPGVEYEAIDQKGLGTTGLTVVMGVSATLLVIVGVVTVMLFRNRGEVEPPVAMKPAPVKVVEDSLPGELYDQMGVMEASALELVKGFAEAKTVEEVMPFLRKSRNLAGLLADQWQPREFREGSVRLLKVNLIKPLDSDQASEEVDNLRMMMEGVTLEGDTVNLIVIHDAEGMLLDWKASFGIGDLTFEGVRRMELDEEAEMRVLVSRDNYFNSMFPESDYYCYSLEDGAEEGVMWGYVPKDSEEKELLSDYLREGSRFFRMYRNLPVILKLKNTGGADYGQFLISEVVGSSWIEP